MTKKQARRHLQNAKHGQTVKEFLTLCCDMGVWFDCIQTDPELLTIYYTLKGGQHD